MYKYHNSKRRPPIAKQNYAMLCLLSHDRQEEPRHTWVCAVKVRHMQLKLRFYMKTVKQTFNVSQ